MATVEVGVRVAPQRTACDGEGASCLSDFTVEPGVVYEVEAHVDGQLRPNPFMAAAEALAAVRRDYPGIIVNYLEVGQGMVRVQVIDAPGPGKVYLIALLITILAILFVSYKITRSIVRIAEIAKETVEEIVEKPGEVVRELGLAGKLLIAGAAVALPLFALGYALRGRRR